MERSGKVGRSERYSKTGRDTNISECDLLSVDKVGILRRCAMMIGLDLCLISYCVDTRPYPQRGN